jgi:hypothetical protein
MIANRLDCVLSVGARLGRSPIDCLMAAAQMHAATPWSRYGLLSSTGGADTGVVMRSTRRTSPAVDWRLSATQLADLLEHAPAMPFMRERVRVGKSDADDLASVLDAEVRDAVDDGRLDKDAGYDVLSVTTRMREDLRNAHPVPLTDQVRVARSEAIDLARALRAAIGAYQ